MRISVCLLRLALTMLLISFAFSSASAEGQSTKALESLLEQLFGTTDSAKAVAPESAVTKKRLPFGQAEVQLSFAPLVKSAAPSVVNVYAARLVKRRSPVFDDPFFGQFFGDEQAPPARMQSSLGSGVIVDAKGIIVTNNHVIAGADEVKVALPDGREFECTILLKDERSDLAVLKISSPDGFPALQLADSDAIEVGDLVLAIGNPFGVGQTTTSGIISALARNQVGVSDFGFFIQTDAAINPGNSGGGLLNMSGEVIGINTAIFSKSGGSVGIGFAIPSNMVRAVVDTALQGGSEFNRPYIGATFEPVSSEIAESLAMDRPLGALIVRIARDGPAELAGLKVGDVVLKVDGHSVEHPDALGYRLSTKGIGKQVQLEVLSRNALRMVNVQLQSSPKSDAGQEKAIEGDNPFAGSVVSGLSPSIAEKLRLDPDRKGVIVTRILRNSAAIRVGLKPGDIIVELNGVEISTVEQVMDVIESRPSFWSFKVDRNGSIIRRFFR